MEQILNFRLVANGMENSEGQKIKNLYRSADVSSASANDIDSLETLGIHDIIDLRTANEITKQLDSEQIKIKHINIIADDKQNQFEMVDVPRLAHIMIDLYQKEFVETDGFKHVLEYILQLEGEPVLFHCTAGKDRTGITAVILMHLLGFSYEDIKAEYLEIDEVLVNFILSKILEQLKDEDVVHIDSLRAVATVSEDFLEAFMLGVTDAYGTVDQFVEAKLDLNAEHIERLKSWYLV